MRPKTKFLTVVWGEAYIERFAELALPSFLAPGNLPALAAAVDLEFVIMTARRNREEFDQHAAFQRLRGICAVRFVDIDDLITSAVYGVTLTLAYGRAVIACGADMLNTHFVFMNADFVLADGSLRGLVKHILAGRSIVLAPSFRATAEALEDTLLEAVDPATQTLAMAPRQLVSLALKDPHPTTIAKTMDQTFCHTLHPNQFFWRVDEHTVVGRYFLIFMLCLKPERVVTTINSYCDYGFIPEMCPSGDEAIMGDSDEFFMLELQQLAQEKFLLRRGRLSDRAIARVLSEWTTAEHRRAAGYDVVFHARGIPPEIEDAKAVARAFIGRICQLLRRPLPHAFHPYWVDGVGTFRRHRKTQGLPASPPELDSAAFVPTRSVGEHIRFYLRTARFWLKALILSCYHVFLGHAPRVTPLHPNWLDYLHLRKTLAAILAEPGARLLVVREDSELLEKLVNPGAPVRFITPRELLRGGLSPHQADSNGYTHALIHVVRVEDKRTRRLVEQCQSMMGPGSSCHLFIHQRDEMTGGEFSLDQLEQFEDGIARPPRASSPTLSQYLEGLVAWAPHALASSFVGGPLMRFNHALFDRLRGHYTRYGLYAVPWILPALMVGFPLVLLTNCWFWRKQPSSRSLSHGSSVLIRVGAGGRVPRE